MSAIRVELGPDAYDVHVGRGALAKLPGLLAAHCPAARYAVIADEHVATIHGERLQKILFEGAVPASVFAFPAGEWNKNREQWAALTDRMIAAGFGRDAAVLAFGGGVAGDLAGFVAATYLRGIPYVQVPTSLLAMIDSSVGGKTGLDVPGGKNLVGAFHQPRLVVADTDLLGTLPRSHIAAGMAEAIKHGVILDAAYFASLADPAGCFARDPERLLEVVRRSVELKAGVVHGDEREAGRRQILNFGHTVGHAVEALSGFDLLHGEAVAIGMAIESRIAEEVGIAERGTTNRIVELTERYGLPSEASGFDADQLLEVMRSDKKVRAGRIRLALPSCIGSMSQGDDGAWTVEVHDEVLIEAMSR